LGLFDKLLHRKPTYDHFAAEFIRAMTAAGARDIRHDALAHSLHTGSGEASHYLDNAFRDYLAASPDGRSVVIQQYVRAFVSRTDVPNDYGTCKTELLPVVRDPAYYSLSELTLKARGSDVSKLKFATQETASGLCVAIAHDTPANIVTVNTSQLQAWNVGFDGAFEQALSNLRDKTDPTRIKQLARGLYRGEWGDYYDTSRILLPEIFHRLSLNGDPVVFLPNRTTLFVTGAYDVAAQALILKHSFQIHFEQGHALSPNFYVHSGENWSLFTPPDAAVAAQARAFQYRRMAIDYEQQKKDLDEIHKKEKFDVFVASSQLLKRKDESMFTRCVWTNGVDTLLPVTETLVLLLDLQSKEMLQVAWEKAFPIVSPHLEKVPGMVPVRYRAKTFPAAEQIQSLRNL